MKTGMRATLRSLVRAPGVHSVSEDRLIAAAQRGEAAAFDALAVLHGEALGRFVRRRVGADHVDDVIQETWIAVWSSLPRYTEKARFRTWLYAIAANKCRDQHRRQTTDELSDEVSVEEREYGRLELRHVVGQVMNDLDPVHREVLEMYYFEELNLSEIATVTGRNLNTVKYQFYRAHKEFANRMEARDAS